MQADAFDDDLLVRDLDLHAHLAEAVDGGQAVFAHQKAGNVCCAAGQRAQHDRAVRNGFVARHGQFTAQRAAGLDLHLFYSSVVSVT